MARALAYVLQFESEVYQHNHLIEIWEEGFIGTPTNLRMGMSGMISKRERDGGIYGTSMELKLESTLDSQLIKLYTSDSKKFLVRHYRNNVLVQSGLIVPEQYSEEYIAAPYDIAVTATDGLGLLKEQNYNYFGRHTVLEVLKYCLDSTGVILDFDLICELTESGADPARSILAQRTIDGEHWRGRTIYDVLTELSATFRAFITQHNGRWRFARYSDLQSQSMIYTNALTYLISLPNNSFVLGNLNNDIYPIGALNFAIDPAFKSVKFTRTYAKRASFFSNPEFKMLDQWDVESMASTRVFRDKNYVILRSLYAGEQISQTIPVEQSERVFNFNISYFRISYTPTVFYVKFKLVGTNGQTYWLGKEGWQSTESSFSMEANEISDVESIYPTSTDLRSRQTLQQTGSVQWVGIPSAGALTLIILAKGPQSVGTDESRRSQFAITDALLTTEVEKGLTVDALLSTGNLSAPDTEIFFGDADVGDNPANILTNFFLRPDGSKSSLWKVGAAGAEDSFFNTIVKDYVVWYGLPKRLLTGEVMGNNLQTAMCLLDKFGDTFMYIDTITLDVFADQAEIEAREIIPHMNVMAVNEEIEDPTSPNITIWYETLPDGTRIKRFTVNSTGSSYRRSTGPSSNDLTLEEILKAQSIANFSAALAALAQRKADEANLAALSAATSADDALLRLNNIASNSIVSIEEKAGLVQLIDRLSDEILLYKADSANKGASVEELEASFNALLDFLTITVEVMNSAAATELTAEEITQYSALFADFYAKKSVFTTDVSSIRAELISFKNRIDSIDQDKAKVLAEHAALINTTGPTEAAKTALTTKKDEYITAHTAYKTALSSAIIDDKITDVERTAANDLFETYSAKLDSFNIAAEAMRKSVTDAINITLSAWIADGVISPLEKLAIRQTRAQVASEKEALVANAAIFDVDSSVYLGAWSAYDAVLNKYSAETPANITVGSDFATTEADYRVAKIALLSAITNVQVDETQGKHPLGGHPDLDLSARDITADSIVSDNFASNGFMGSGYKLSKDAEGKTKLEVDELLVRQSAKFYELIIQQAKHQGGIVFYTAASMECISVTEQADSYRCFFDTKDGQIPNEWAVNDQARCQRFAGKYYWRKVIAIGTDYIDLSKADTNGAGVPEAGDIIVQLGNRTDTSRQAAKVTTVIGADAPRDEFYEGINSYDLTGKLITIVGIKDGKAGIYTSYGEFAGKVTVGAGSSGLSGLSEWAAAAQDIEAAQSTANQAVQSAASLQSFIDNTLPTELSSLQAQIDGQVESWDFPYVPTLSNYPASEWTTDALKDRHIHDTFFNNQPFVDNTTTPDAGKAWRFTKSGGTYFWNPISDSDAVKALALAAAAQDTADGKRRVFVTQPTTPYDVGDLWTQGTSGELMRCINARLSGAYVAGDWDKAVKYTDDTAVNNMRIGGRNLVLKSNVVASGTGRLQGYTLSEPLIIGQQYAVSVKGVVGIDAKFNVWCNDSVTAICGLPASGVASNVFTYQGGLDPLQISVYSEFSDNPSTVYWVQIEKGNKASDHKVAIEDIYADATAKSNAAIATAQEYALAKANLAEVTAKAYADGIVTEEETRAIADATAKANAAQAAAIAAAALDATAKVGAVQIGGRNLALQSDTVVTGTFLLKIYQLSRPLEPGKTYAVSVKGDVGAGASFNVWYAAGMIPVLNLPSTGIAKGTFFCGVVTPLTEIRVYSEASSNPSTVYWVKIEEGNKCTDFTIAPEDVQKGIDDAREDAADAQTSANNANTAVESLNTYVDGAFKDGVIESSEAKAIEKYKNIVSESRTTAENEYNNLYINSYLDGTPKTNLLNAKITLFGAVEALLSSVNTAIADGQTTPAEKADVDSKYSTYIAAMGAYKAAVEAASKAIQDKLNQLSSDKVAAIKIGGRNLITYAALEGVVLLYGVSATFENIPDTTKPSKQVFKWSNIVRTEGNYVFYIPTFHSASRFSESLLGKDIVLSFFIKTNNTQLLSGFGSGGTQIGPEWTRVVLKGTFTGSNLHYLLAGAGLTTMEISSVQLEFGNMATDFQFAPEDTQAAIDTAAAAAASAQAKATEAAAVTSKFGTTIDGGLVTTSLIKLRDAQTPDGQETGGINGLKGNGDNPAFWAGGNYSQALQMLASIVFNHSGDGKIGDLFFEQNGTITIKDPVSGETRVQWGATALPLLADLLSTSQVTATANNLQVTRTTVGETALPNTLNVTKDNSKLTFYANIDVSAFAPPAGESAVTVKVVLYRNGVEYATAGRPTWVLSQDDGPIPSITVPVALNLSSVPVGTYSIKFILEISAPNTTVTATLGASALTFLFVNDIQQVRYGIDGFMAFYSAQKYFYLSNKSGMPFLQARGTWDVPGLRGAASVTSGGGVGNMYGIALGAALTGRGSYTITHNLGRTDYTVNVTVINLSGRVNAVVTGKSNNYCTVRIVNAYTDALVNSDFDITICANA